MEPFDVAKARSRPALFGDRVTFERARAQALRPRHRRDARAWSSRSSATRRRTPSCSRAARQQLVELVKLGRPSNDIPLTPRGKASSGYGGVIPVKNGLVVDFYFMKDILAVDRRRLTVTVEPGITWEQLDREIKKQGLTLRLYPTSYPSSSVGGWLAQGGAGIGSYEFGWFRENVVCGPRRAARRRGARVQRRRPRPDRRRRGHHRPHQPGDRQGAGRWRRGRHRRRLPRRPRPAGPDASASSTPTCPSGRSSSSTRAWPR